VAAVIMTKMDGHAKGGGALSAVAATQSPVLFIGTGEHVDEFETFEAEAFVGRLLGQGDVKGLMGKLTDIMPEQQQEEMMSQLAEGALLSLPQPHTVKPVPRQQFRSAFGGSGIRFGRKTCLCPRPAFASTTKKRWRGAATSFRQHTPQHTHTHTHTRHTRGFHPYIPSDFQFAARHVLETLTRCDATALSHWLLGERPTGQFPLRIMYEQFNNVLQMGPMGQVMGMLPGFGNLMSGPGREQASAANLRKYIALMDSMTSKELDNPDITENLRNLSDPSRVKRIVRGSGRSYRDVAELATHYKAMSTMISKMKDQLKPSRVGASNMRSQNAQLAQMGKALSAANPAVLQQIGGMSGLKQMMKAMDGGGDLSSLASAMGGGGGGAGGRGGRRGAAGLGGAGGAKGRRR